VSFRTDELTLKPLPNHNYLCNNFKTFSMKQNFRVLSTSVSVLFGNSRFFIKLTLVPVLRKKLTLTTFFDYISL
jgi:hypothetical protein